MTTLSVPARRTPNTAARAGSRAWLSVCGVLFAIAWGGNEFTPLLVMYRQEGLTSQAVNVLLGAYVLGIIPALLIGGPMSDRYGRRPLLLPAPLLGMLGSLSLALGSEHISLLFAGRILSGLALGLVMAVGTSWVKELSQPPFEATADAGLGARRASLALTAGFGLGAVVAAAVAQWGPARTLLPYAINITVTALLAVPMLRAPETHVRQSAPGRLRDDLRIPAARHRRFLYVVLPMAPWVFGTAACAYAILPALMVDQVRGFEIGFSGLLCFVALSCGIVAQQIAKKVDTPHNSRAVTVALAVTVLGMAAAAWASQSLNLVVATAAAAILGAAYGLLLVSGLQEAQRIAGPDGLAGLIAVYYSITYLGFFVPAVLASLAARWSYTQMFGAGVVIATICLAVVASCWCRHLPLHTPHHTPLQAAAHTASAAAGTHPAEAGARL
ncbi:MAG: MFS transporter [Cellulomonadaceae bacterium]